jgi:hypothetical protein
MVDLNLTTLVNKLDIKETNMVNDRLSKKDKNERFNHFVFM